MYTERTIKVPNHDCDITLRFPSGKIVQVQCRPSNADVGYNGSLDIILPDDRWVTNWEGDDMKPAAISPDGRLHLRQRRAELVP